MNNDNNKNVVPLIVNGEINDGRNRKNKPVKEEKLPTKKFTFFDFILSLIGVALVVYGVMNFSIEDKKETKNSSSNVESNVTSQENEVKNEIDYKKLITFDKYEIYNIYSSNDLSLMTNGLDVTNLSNNAKIAIVSRISPNKGNYILVDELDKTFKRIFDTTYEKDEFIRGNYVYTYNKETGRYYLKSNEKNQNITYNFYNYIEEEKNGNDLILKDYVLYESNTNKWSLSNTIVDSSVTKDNMKDNKDKLKYFEYKFTKSNDDYILKTITIK